MLEINIPTIIFEILNFVVLSALLYIFLLKPGIKKVQARREVKMIMEKEIQENLAISEQSRIEWEKTLENIQEKVSDIVEKNRKQMELESEDILQDVKQEAKAILDAAQLEARKKQEQVMIEFQDKVIDAIIEISAQVIGKSAPEEIHEIFFKQMNERIWQLGRDEMNRVENIRRSLDKRKPTAYVKTAKALTPEQKGLLVRTLSALADSEIHLELNIEPQIAAGIYVRIGDVVLDNSIYSQLEEYRQEISSLINDRVVNE